VGIVLASERIGAGDQDRGGRPKTPPEIRHLIRKLSLANSLWGAPPIHGELLKLGIDFE
jgi:hypothetical protein